METCAGSVVRVDEDVVARSERRVRRVEGEPNVEILIVVGHVHLAKVGAGGGFRRVGVGDRNAGPIAKRAVNGDAFERASVSGNGEARGEESGERRAKEGMRFHRSSYDRTSE